jgi:hypothetical protein
MTEVVKGKFAVQGSARRRKLNSTKPKLPADIGRGADPDSVNIQRKPDQGRVNPLYQHPRVVAAKRRAEPEVEFRYVPRLEPGTYRAYCRSARIYRDRVYQRWVCAVQFDVLAENNDEVLGRLTWFLNLGNWDKPNASRRSRYWQAWSKANGGPPQRRDRLSPRVFSGRIALVEVGDTIKNCKQQPVAGANSYSVVRDVKEWQTGHHQERVAGDTDGSSARAGVVGRSTQPHPKGGRTNGSPVKG